MIVDGNILAAHSAVARAIREGRLAKQPCARCSAIRAVAHHEDYGKPLEVTWLCGKCHSLRHWERGDLKPRGRKQPLALNLPPDLIAQVDVVADREERSRSKMIEMLIRLGLQHWQVREAA